MEDECFHHQANPAFFMFMFNSLRGVVCDLPEYNNYYLYPVESILVVDLRGESKVRGIIFMLIDAL